MTSARRNTGGPGCQRGDILMRTRLVATALLAALLPAAAQTALPYAIETFGAFRKVILEGDFSPKVSLGAVMANKPDRGRRHHGARARRDHHS